MSQSFEHTAQQAIANSASSLGVATSRVIPHTPSTNSVSHYTAMCKVPASKAKAGHKQQSFRPKRNLVGLFYSGHHGTASSQLVTGSLLQAKRMKLTMLQEDIDLWPDTSLQRIVDWCIEQRLRGALLAEPLAGNLELCAQLLKHGITVIQLAPDNPSSGISHVTTDHHLAGYQLARQLLAAGHQRIEFITGNRQQASVRGYYQGYLDATRHLSIGTDLLTLSNLASLNDEDIQGQVNALLAQPNRPTAMICLNDEHALIAHHVASQRGLGDANQLLICCIGPSPCSNKQQIYAVTPPYLDMAASALELLLKVSKNPIEQTGLSHQVAYQFAPMPPTYLAN